MKKTAEIATAFKMDGMKGGTINNFARGSRERDMFKWTLSSRIDLLQFVVSNKG